MKTVLDDLCKSLDYKSGSLFTATDQPGLLINCDDWVEKGEWLSAAKRAGAASVFFIDNNPLVVFAECGSDHREKVETFNRIWSLARPRLLFLASPGEITALDLAQAPLKGGESKKFSSAEEHELKTLATLHDLGKIAQEFQDFHRDNIESGKVFADSRFGDIKNRADKALIRDLKTVRCELVNAGLSEQKLKFAHALIGRSIFIRYLEDRGILPHGYFLELARQNADWEKLIQSPTPRVGLDFSERQTFYPKVLESKEFTYTLYRSLAQDFNGDMFPDVDEEERNVTQEHLKLIQDLLYGDVGRQKKLFFHSYRFDVVPIDLISSIYEEFYHSSVNDDEKQNKARQDGAFYTPSVLVELLLSRILTAETLQKKPRVLDPACGSGIFLVESFRRIVRYEWYKNSCPLGFDRLKEILCEQIAGIEVKEEAARITAFSLYLAMLHYLDPPAISEQIKQGKCLPSLLVSGKKSISRRKSIWVGNAFDISSIESSALLSSSFDKKCADVIVGNPPWGAPGSRADALTKEREKIMLEWCRVNGRPIGGKEASQAFLWRTLDFLKEGGKAGMLVSAGVLFKHGVKTREFRKQWFDSVRVNEVFNFIHVRKFFFKGAISPFVGICFAQEKQDDFPVKYWSAKQVMASKETQAVLLSKYDVHTLRGEDLAANKLWKSYWFGRLADSRFIKWLHSKKQLGEYVDRKNSGRGYQLYKKNYVADRLQAFKSLSKLNSRYDAPEFTPPPSHVYVPGIVGAYNGLRVLVNEGILENSEPKGRIIAQLADIPFCFYRSIYGLKLLQQEEWCHKVLLAILWSSLARYYFFMTSANWGLWHHKLLLDELLQLPVVLNESIPITQNIVAIVDKLRNYQPQLFSLLNPDGIREPEIKKQRCAWEKELDEAVFELYGLNQEQKDLVLDCCEVTIPFFYNPLKSAGTRPAVRANDLSWIENYVHIFARRWNAYLDDFVEMRAQVHVGAHENIVAVDFYPADKSEPWSLYPKDNSWQDLLEQIGRALPQPLAVSQILVDGVAHVITNEAVIVIKRNEKRLWTRSLAREDADATLCKRMTEFKFENGGQN